MSFSEHDIVTIARRIDIDSAGRPCVPAWPELLGRVAVVIVVDEPSPTDGSDVAVKVEVDGAERFFYLSSEALDAGYIPPDVLPEADVLVWSWLWRKVKRGARAGLISGGVDRRPR